MSLIDRIVMWIFVRLKKPVPVYLDGRCGCSCADPCPLGKRGVQERCTQKELKAAGVAVITALDT